MRFAPLAVSGVLGLGRRIGCTRHCLSDLLRFLGLGGALLLSDPSLLGATRGIGTLFGDVITVARSLALDGHGCPIRHMTEQHGCDLGRHPDAAMRGGLPRIGDRPGVQAHAVVGQAHEKGHFRTLEASAIRDRIASDLDAGAQDTTALAIDLAVEIRALVLDLLRHLETAGRGRILGQSGRDRAPADLFVARIEAGFLLIGVDDDARDLTSIALPLIERPRQLLVLFRRRLGRG